MSRHGGHNVYRVFEDQTPDQLRESFAEIVESERKLKLLFAEKVITLTNKDELQIRQDQVFDADNEARNWIANEATLKGPLLAVRVRGVSKVWKDGMMVFTSPTSSGLYWIIGGACKSFTNKVA